MAIPLDSHIRPDNAHFQLWADLNCPGLYAPNPINDAIWEGKDLDKKQREHVLRLRDCHMEAPRA